MTDPPGLERSWLHPAVAPGPSAIEGSGLIASTALPAGIVVVRLGGRIVDQADLDALLGARAADPSLPYVDCLTVDDGRHLVLAPGDPVHYGNHSCDPSMWHDGPYELVLRRAAAAGEELTIDYATHTADPSFALRCRCGSARCRGTVCGDDWRRPELQQRYAGHWVPALRRLIAGAARESGAVGGDA